MSLLSGIVLLRTEQLKYTRSEQHTFTSLSKERKSSFNMFNFFKHQGTTKDRKIKSRTEMYVNIIPRNK
jgi:hypothetical protein